MISKNAQAWSLPRVMDFFEQARSTTTHVYPSEWLFLRDRLREGMSALDIGCAQGGFCGVLGEHLKEFRYTGLDISPDAVARARQRHPAATFHVVPEGDYGILAGQRFDLVLVLGILHLHEGWRETIRAAWAATGETLLLDFRETHLPSIEDKSVSYFRMDFHGGGEAHARATLPYIILNAGDAHAAVMDLCPGAGRISHYGYTHRVSSSAVTPIPTVLTDVWCIER